MSTKIATTEQKTGGLVPLEGVLNPAISKKELSTISGGADFLPRLQFCSAKTNVVVEGKVQMNHFAVIKGTNIDDLGLEVDVVPFSYRAKAMIIEESQVLATATDLNGKLYAEIKELAGEKGTGAMYGPEFLVWIPSRRVFATFFCGNATARVEAPNIEKLLNKGTTLKSKLCKNRQHKWMGPLVLPAATPVRELPELDDLKTVAQKFNTETDRDTRGEEAEDTGRAR